MIKIEKKYTITFDCDENELRDLYKALVYNNGNSSIAVLTDFLDQFQKDLEDEVMRNINAINEI